MEQEKNKQSQKNSQKETEEKKPKTSEGVPDGDGGSLERDDSKNNSEGNSLGNDSDNRRENEGVEGTMKTSAGSNDVNIRADFHRGFYFSSNSNRTIACVASSEGGYYFKGE